MHDKLASLSVDCITIAQDAVEQQRGQGVGAGGGAGGGCQGRAGQGSTRQVRAAWGRAGNTHMLVFQSSVFCREPNDIFCQLFRVPVEQQGLGVHPNVVPGAAPGNSAGKQLPL